ncbi:MAG: transposase [Caldilinea sp.]|nr:transposase [Caldilinea sp.]
MAHEPDPEVLPKAERRQFSAEYKLRVLVEADRCSEPGQIGALLRREGLYSSHLSKWRQQRERGALSQQRGRKADPQTAELKRLQRENERLRSRLERAEHIIEVQKKLAELLGTTLNEIPSNEP